MTNYHIQALDSHDVLAHLDDFVELLQNSVENGASVSFVVTPTLAEAQAYWRKVAQEVADQERYVLASIADGHVMGCVHLALAGVPNGIHRAEVQKMLIHTDFRRRGIAKHLLREIEVIAKQLGRTTLVLDTEEGNPAELLYSQMGWQRVGIIPKYALHRNELIATVIFYKLLA
jgi:acetyltransferase